MTTTTDRLITKLNKLDGDINTLKARLNAKLDEQADVLAKLQRAGEANRHEVNGIASVTQGLNWINTGRVLSDEQVRAIRKAWKAGQSQTSIAREYGLSQPSVFKIVHRQSYQDVA